MVFLVYNIVCTNCAALLIFGDGYLTKRIYTLKEAREILGLSKKDLSKASGISMASIRYIEDDVKRVSKTNYGVALELARALGLSVEEIKWPRGLTNEGRPPKTGTPIAAYVVIRTALCPSCFMELPSSSICDNCS
jgi:DNA-binding XRE family transcriptional regulator